MEITLIFLIPALDQSSVHITDFLSSTEPSPRMPRKNLLQDGPINGLRLSMLNIQLYHVVY